MQNLRKVAWYFMKTQHEDSDSSIKRLNVEELLNMVKEVYDTFIEKNSLVSKNESPTPITAYTATNKFSTNK